MNFKFTNVIIALALLAVVNRAPAQGTAFTYQGELNNANGPASGTYNLTFSLFNVSSGGSAIAGPAVTNGVIVTNGLFTVMVDFGAGVWNGQTNWLEIGVETNGTTPYTTMVPRQQLTPVPYAIFAETASNLSGTVSAAQVNGTVALAQLPPSVLVNNASGVALTGTFNGNGTGLAGVNAAQLNGLNATNFWQLGGNNVSATQILGTTNNQPLAIVAGGQLAGLITAEAGGPEIIWGNSNNVISSGFPPGASILGGSGNAMSGSANYAVIAGGQSNTLGYSFYSAIGGGLNNRVGQSSYDVVAGGTQNSIGTGSSGAVIVGGENNLIAGNTPGAFVGGGVGNTNYGNYGFLGGGYYNTNDGNYGFLGGGYYNTLGVNGTYGVVAGGYNNLVNGNYATVPGGNNNVASGKYGFAAGNNAESTNQGAFVWADSQGAPFTSTNNDSFNVRAQGGMRLVTSGGGLTVDATVTATNFAGNAAGLTNLQATQLTGIVLLANLPINLVTNTESGVTLNSLNVGGNLTLPSPAAIYSGATPAFYADASYNVFAGLGAGLIPPAGLDNTAVGGIAMGSSTSDSGLVAIGYAALQADKAGTSVILPNGHTFITSGENTAVGYEALQQNTVGTSNTAVGYDSMNYNINGSQNTAVGASALYINTSSDNTAVGSRALVANTTGDQNTALGANALSADNGDSFNTAVGYQALQYNSSAAGNTAIGWQALNQNQSGFGNTASGWAALMVNTSGYNNTADGFQALTGNTVGTNNTATGYGALLANQAGNYNTANGYLALTASTGGYDTAVGGQALLNNVTGNYDTALGDDALKYNTSGNNNVAVGYSTLRNSTGNNNVAVGYEAGQNLTSGDNNIYIGYAGNSSESGMIYIGDPNVQTATYLAGTAYVQILAITSDRNAKENFAAIDSREVLAKVAALPVTQWNYKTDRKDQQHIGPMAQDFQAAFGLNGRDDKHISMADEGGVALAAIQGLNQKLEEENTALKQQNDALAKRLNDLAQAVQALTEKK